MAKQITLKVDFCDECPMFDKDDFLCTEEHKHIEDNYDIPEWCPLEEY